MKKYNKIVEKEILSLFEMANISSKTAGIKKGIIQIRPESRHSLFPHIHYVHNIKKQNDTYAKFSLSDKKDKIEIIEIQNIKLSIDEIEEIKIFIIKNYEKLKEYYLQAEFIVDTKEFLDSLEKI